MATVEKQLTDGKRLHQSLLDNAKRHASLLRGRGADNDPRVLEVADLIDERIGSIPNIQWMKSNGTKPQSSDPRGQHCQQSIGRYR